MNVALAALHLGQYDRARSLLRESLALSHRIGDVVGIVYAIECLGAILAEQANCEPAAKLLAGAQMMKESIALILHVLAEPPPDLAAEFDAL